MARHHQTSIRLLDLNTDRLQHTEFVVRKALDILDLDAKVWPVAEHLEISRHRHGTDNTAVEVDGRMIARGIFNDPAEFADMLKRYMEWRTEQEAEGAL